MLKKNDTIMSSSKAIEKQRETKLKSAKIEDGFYNIIGGQRLAAASNLSVINPATGKELATVPDIGTASLDDAVDAARKALPAWRSLPLPRRKEILNDVLTEIDRHAEELSVLLTAEQGRPLFQARWEIDLLTKLYGPAFMQMDLPEIEQKVAHIGHVFKRYTPIGVVGALIPWNLPVILSFMKVLPALLAGNTVILKPSPFTPLTVLHISDYIRELLPAGVLNTVTGGDELGPWMTSHPGIDHISFTGSTATGKRVLASASATLKRVSLELGGNDPGIVLADANPQAIAQDLSCGNRRLGRRRSFCKNWQWVGPEHGPRTCSDPLAISAATIRLGGDYKKSSPHPVPRRCSDKWKKGFLFL